MSISKSLVDQLANKNNPNDRMKYLHLRKDIILSESPILSLDGKTYNGKDHLDTSIADGVSPSLKKIRFDAATVAFKENQFGDMDISIVLKSPKDEYTKKIGANLSSVVLLQYLQIKNKVNMWHYSHHFGYHSFVVTLPFQTFIESSGEATFPDYFVSQLGVSYLRNTLVTKILKEEAFNVIESLGDHSGNNIWVPTIDLNLS